MLSTFGKILVLFVASPFGQCLRLRHLLCTMYVKCIVSGTALSLLMLPAAFQLLLWDTVAHSIHDISHDSNQIGNCCFEESCLLRPHGFVLSESNEILNMSLLSW